MKGLCAAGGQPGHPQACIDCLLHDLQRLKEIVAAHREDVLELRRRASHGRRRDGSEV